MRSFVSLLAVLAVACTSNAPAPGPTVCTPATKRACPCSGGGTGVETCTANGDGWSPCDCADAGSGGSSGTSTTATTPGSDSSFDPAAHETGVHISEADACARYVNALKAQVASACVGPHTSQPLECVSYIRYGVTACGAEYDQGVVDACVAYIQTLTCDKLVDHPCALVYFTGTGDPSMCGGG